MRSLQVLCAVLLLACSSLEAWTADPQPGKDAQGDPLPAGALARLGTVRFRQLHPGTCLGFSRNDKYLVTGSSDGTARVWEVASGRLVQQLIGHKGGITAVRFTADGNHIVTAAHDATLRLWDASTGAEERVFSGHTSSVRCLALSSDDKTLYSAGFDRVVRIWDVESGKEKGQLVGHKQAVTAMDLSPDDKHLVTASQDGTMRLWDPAQNKEMLSFDTGKVGRVGAVALATDGKMVFGIGSQSRTLHAWDRATGKEVRTYSAKQNVANFNLAPGGGFAALAEYDPLSKLGARTIRIIELPEGKESRAFELPAASITGLAYSHDGKLLAICGGDGAIRVLNAATGQLQQQGVGHAAAVLSLVFAPDGKHVCSLGADNTLRTWDAATGKQIASHADVPSRLATLAVNSAEDKLIVASAGHRVLTADLAALLRGEPRALLRQELPLSAAQSRVSTVTSDGAYAAVSEGFREIQVLDCEKAQERAKLSFPPAENSKTAVPLPDDRPMALALTPDARTLAARCADGALRFWDVEERKQKQQVENAGSRGPLQFAPDGRTLLAADTYVHLWEVCSGRERWRFEQKRVGGVGALAFSPDGRLAAVGNLDRDGTISVRAAVSGKELAMITTGQGPIRALRFSPDGQRLASGGTDTTILIWDVSAHARTVQRALAKLEPTELAKLWSELAQADPAKAAEAIDRLAAAPEQAVAFIKENIKSPTSADEKTIAKLIAALDDDDEKVRDQATAALQDLGEQAVPALQKLLEGAPSPEVRTRAQSTLGKQKQGGGSAEARRTVRAIEVLELAETSAAQELLDSLAKNHKSSVLAQEARAALERLRKKR